MDHFGSPFAPRSVQECSPEFGGLGFGSLFGGKGRPKGAVLKIMKIENGTKTDLYIVSRHFEPLKMLFLEGSEKT